jgi:hypothetical protein
MYMLAAWHVQAKRSVLGGTLYGQDASCCNIELRLTCRNAEAFGNVGEVLDLDAISQSKLPIDEFVGGGDI